MSDAENVREQAESIIQDENETPTVLDKVDKMGEGDTAEQVSELKKASDERIVGN